MTKTVPYGEREDCNDPRLRYRCSDCGLRLLEEKAAFRCQRCGKLYPVRNGIPSFLPTKDSWQEFYDEWHLKTSRDIAPGGCYKNERGGVKRRIKMFLKRSQSVVAAHDFVYFHDCRKSAFLRRNLTGSDSGAQKILDVGCGKGNPLLREFGWVAGIDSSLQALESCRRDGHYDLLVHGDICELPFEDRQFDVVVSVFVYGHVENGRKDGLLKEIYRVLKPHGRAIMVIETDSENFCLAFAKRHPQLYWDNVIMQYGHIGLEMPGDALRRFEENGLVVKQFAKTWGPVWSIGDYLEVFDNDYKSKSRALKAWLALMRLARRYRPLEVGFNCILGIICRIYDRVTSLEEAMGLMIIAEKKVPQIS